MQVFSKLNKTPNMYLIFRDLFPPFGFPGFASAILLCFLGFYIIKRLSGDGNVPVRDSTKNHSWIPITISSKAWYCSICESLLLHGIGVYCDCCGVCADPDCVKKANIKLKCKVITSNDENQVHHWVKGNLCLGTVCKICKEECSMEPGLVDFQCCWCQTTVHTECLSKMEAICDFGPYKNMIVPPWCVQVAKRKGTLNKHLLLRGVKDPGWDNWTPLVVIANKKSGNSDGAVVLSEFRKYLNPVQVIDLSERKPPAALQWCVLLAPKEIRVLVGGGDGTIAWVLTSSHKLDLDPEPPLAIIPLGTGNDLSRVLGWGKENPPELHVDTILRDIQQARVSELDRWKVEVTSTRHLGLKLPSKTYFMYNYLSIGVDAMVTLNFHKTRDSAFYVYGSRLFNKMLYLCFGTHQVVTADCKNLEQRLDLYLDGRQVELPEIEGVVVLNIPSWGAGVNLWGSNDGLTRTNQSYPRWYFRSHRTVFFIPYGPVTSWTVESTSIRTSKVVEMCLKEKAPMQVDGEPWEQHPGKLKISFVNRCPVLVNQNKCS